MKKNIFVDIGHGGRDVGAMAADGTFEKDINLKVGLILVDKLKEDNRFEVKASRETDVNLTLSERASMSNAWGADVFISIHHNAANKKASGAELIHTIHTTKSQGDEIAEYIAKEFEASGQHIRRIFSKENSKGQDWYGVIRYTFAPAVITEYAFIDNAKDLFRIDDEEEYIIEAMAIYTGLIKYFGFTEELIMGTSQATAEQMDAFLRKVNPEAPEVAQIYLDEGKAEGVRGDVAFAQALKETNYWRFTGIAKPEWHNPAGLGVTGPAGIGNRFPDWKTGIRAQIQHLKAYASKEPLNKPLVDVRFNLVPRGIAPTWEGLNGKWAVPGPTYGQDIVRIWKNILKMPVTDWEQQYYILKEQRDKALFLANQALKDLYSVQKIIKEMIE